jgi:hypothetical protein
MAAAKIQIVEPPRISQGFCCQGSRWERFVAAPGHTFHSALRQPSFVGVVLDSKELSDQ